MVTHYDYKCWFIGMTPWGWQAWEPEHDVYRFGRTRAEVQAAVDEWIEENEPQSEYRAVPGFGIFYALIASLLLWAAIFIVWRYCHG